MKPSCRYFKKEGKCRKKYKTGMEEKTLFLFLIGNFGAKEAVAPVDDFHKLCDSPIKIFSQTFTLRFNRNA